MTLLKGNISRTLRKMTFLGAHMLKTRRKMTLMGANMSTVHIFSVFLSSPFQYFTENTL